MNIKRAKEEIRSAIEAYLMKDEYGDYLIPAIRQRPMLLMGPPGIGKTQIMAQIAKECGISLVSYTITHHTRQSATGLPFIKEKQYDGQKYSATEYTMSEIIASVYDKIEKTGIREGVLFIDEINCVSETLAPTMLQFLQCKTFGNQSVPEGWIIVTAGNPPEYNKSVREFDVVTLDRIRKMDVEENFEVWKEYALRENVHPAIITYLELKKNHFYQIETTVDGKLFVTARGWEDLSAVLKVYERLGRKADRELVYQYIQHGKIAKDFANYLELYEKYKQDYGLERVLTGEYQQQTLEKLKFASFDERLSVVGLLTAKLGEYFQNCYQTDQMVTAVYECLKRYMEDADLTAIRAAQEAELEQKQKAEQLTKEAQRRYRQVIRYLEELQRKIAGQPAPEELVRAEFAVLTAARDHEIQQTAEALEHAFIFLEKAFGDSQEMVVFVTDLNTNYYSVEFIRTNGSDKYDQYNKKLLFHERHEQIRKELRNQL